MEEWRKFHRYMVSNHGKIASIRFPGKFLKPDVDKDGYEHVRLQNAEEPVKTKMSVSRIIALTFIPNPDNKPTVDHINKDKRDNRVENLRWASHLEQCNNRTSRMSNTGNKYIMMRNDRFRVSMPGLDRSFKTLEEAIRARDINLQKIKSNCLV
jgi:hypothetical protein